MLRLQVLNKIAFEPLRFFQVQIDISLSAFELDISQPPQHFMSNELDIVLNLQPQHFISNELDISI